MGLPQDKYGNTLGMRWDNYENAMWYLSTSGQDMDRYAQILPDMPRQCQISSDIARQSKYGQILLYMPRQCQISPDIARQCCQVCPDMPSQIWPDSIGYAQILPDDLNMARYAYILRDIPRYGPDMSRQRQICTDTARQSKYDQMYLDFAGSVQMCPDMLRQFQICPAMDRQSKYGQICSDIARSAQIVSDICRYCQVVRYCQIV